MEFSEVETLNEIPHLIDECFCIAILLFLDCAWC